ncbi:hypothetical protein PSPO01_01997 [Paraphaeosphaeria sporulosa]
MYDFLSYQKMQTLLLHTSDILHLAFKYRFSLLARNTSPRSDVKSMAMPKDSIEGVDQHYDDEKITPLDINHQTITLRGCVRRRNTWAGSGPVSVYVDGL